MLVMHIISNLRAGGAETSLFQLAKSNTDDRQIVVSMQDHGVFGQRLEAAGIEVCTLGMRPGGLTVSGIRKLFKLIRSKQPDVIQTWMYHADLVGGLVARVALNNRVCWGIHHSNLERKANPTALLAVVKCCAITSWFVPKKIISCSEKSMQVHQESMYRKGIFTVVPNGYDLQKFVFDQHARDTFRASINAESEIVLGMVGRWHPQKDHQNLIDAVAIYNSRASKTVRCVLVGDGLDESNSELMDALQASEIRDSFVLMGKTDDVPSVMSGIDLHVLSSRGEAFPNVVAEAMACQTPCVVTDVGDAALIVGETGWVAQAESAEALADQIANAIQATQQPADWQKRQAACRARIVDGYEIGHIVRQYQQVWRSISKR